MDDVSKAHSSRSGCVLSISGGAFFYFSRNAALKRKLQPFWVIGTDRVILRLRIFQRALQKGPFIYVFVLAAVVIAYQNIKRVKFCDTCGRTVFGANLSAPRHCIRCGSSLES